MNNIEERVVTFPLTKEMTIVEFVSNGFRRKEVEILFQKLEEAGFGKYIPGHVGRGHASRFVANDNCPLKYTIAFKIKKQIKEPAELPEPHYTAEQIRAFEKKPLRAPPPFNGKGYLCLFGNGYVFVERFQGCGFKNIDAALHDIWKDIKNYVSAKGTKHMSPKDEVASFLMGSGFYKLSKKPTNNPLIDRKNEEDDE